MLNDNWSVNLRDSDASDEKIRENFSKIGHIPHFFPPRPPLKHHHWTWTNSLSKGPQWQESINYYMDEDERTYYYDENDNIVYTDDE